MAMDSSWDNSGLPPRKQGMPTWVKILGGCGIVFLLLLGGCVALGFYGIHKASEIGKSQWPSYVETVKALEDPGATQALYEANPGLQKEFADTAAFEQQVATWRPAIQTPPAEMPSLTSGRVFSFIGRNHTYRMDGDNQPSQARNGAAAGYKMDDGRFLVVAWQDGKIVEIQFDRRRGGEGFDRR